MRRLLLVFLMFLLPLQSTWAAAAGVCAHEQERVVSHFGHHAHEHVAPAVEPEPEQPGGALEYHADCNVCHGVGTAFVSSGGASTFASSIGIGFVPYRAVVPDRAPDTLLRPPLALVS